MALQNKLAQNESDIWSLVCGGAALSIFPLLGGLQLRQREKLVWRRAQGPGWVTLFLLFSAVSPGAAAVASKGSPCCW